MIRSWAAIGPGIDALKASFSPAVEDGKGSSIANLSVERGWASIALPLTADIIENCGTARAEVPAELALPTNRSPVFDLTPFSPPAGDQANCSLWARESDLMTDTNPISLRLQENNPTCPQPVY